MASSGTLLFIFTALCVTAVKSGFVKVECKAENVGHYGQQSLLECVIKTTTDINDPNIRMVAWKKLTSPEDEGDLLLGFNRGKLDQPKRGYRFAEPSWDEKNMNVSLLITNTAVADDGYYKCIVITDIGDGNKVTNLKVQARYSISTVYSIPEKIVPNTDSTLICESRGGYPQGTIRWFDEEKHEWTGSSEMEVTQSDDGLFQLTSRLFLLRGSTFLKYICAVFNASGGKEDEIIFEMPAPPSARYSVPTVYSIPEKIVPNTNSTLICETHGGYPKGTLHWFDEEGNDWTKSSEMEVTQSDDGLLQLTSRLHLFRGATFQRYTCVVLNASGGKEDEIIFEMPAPPRLTPPSGPEPIEICKTVARLVVTGSLMVGLLCVLLFYRWRAQQVQKCSTEPRTVYRPEVNL
ncbi:hemicentin-1-like [Simochromis diagramma]|uniref:hemicentin-1-like n=1 Tax=Simochromis diagramma TaxID=43689 RepID=UPI001A7EC7BF|nr:hemicentin-1-like [Simochromis diagramma]